MKLKFAVLTIRNNAIASAKAKYVGFVFYQNLQDLLNQILLRVTYSIFE